ncbi:MAG: histidine--tRNA ligase [Candidatus Omnitrophica bacterium]|nr:histidine--tRNA ligase [Candidatus Omnitrophota bacterium]
MSKYHSLRGMPDIPPEEARLFRWVEDRAREVFGLFEFSEIRTPLLEETEVFKRSIGEDTDIVGKEMYSFPDRGGKDISLRPEGTASVVRAYIEHGWHTGPDILKLFYMGPMFRGERPQKGRLRQFHQIGAEIMGSSGPYLDAELILSLVSVLESLKVKGYEISLNSLGCVSDRVSYRTALKDFLLEEKADLCDDCGRRVETNVLRVLDCKRAGCGSVLKNAPRIADYLCARCAKEHNDLVSILGGMQVDFSRNDYMVRGLDYYTGTVFEVVHPALGAQNAVAAGGRYDDLTKQMGGPDVGAAGYSIGVERILLAVGKEAVPCVRPGVLIVAVDDLSRDEAFRLTNGFRAEGISCDMDHSGRSLKGGLRRANKEKRRNVILLGEDEVKKGRILLKDMKSGEQRSLSFEEAVRALKEVEEI